MTLISPTSSVSKTRRIKMSPGVPFLLLLTSSVLLLFNNAPKVLGDNTQMCEKDMCFCEQDIEPVEILCDNLKLRVLFEDTDWNATLEKLNITDRKLDVSFVNNYLFDVPKFPSLKIVMLSFHRNFITQIADSAFSELAELDSLNLSYNNLTGDSLTESVFFGKFDQEDSKGYFPLPMTHLNLSHNRIHSINKYVFDHLTSLTTLDLSHNPLKVLSGSTSSAISSLRKLEFLGLSHTSVESISEGMLHDLIYLTALDLSFNNFKIVPKELGSTHALTVLKLDGNIFETLNNNSFIGLNMLLDLSIQNIPTLRSIDKGTFGPLKNLSKLEISFNRRLTKINDGAFDGLVSKGNEASWPVKEIRLNDNGLSRLDQSLLPWEYVDYIDIQNNPFRCDCYLDWMITILVDRIGRNNMHNVKNLYCAEPPELKAKSLDALASEPELFTHCKSGKSSLLNVEDDGEFNADPFQTAGITILVIGILFIILGVSILGFVFVKRRAIAADLMRGSQIRYERAETDEGEFGDGNPPRDINNYPKTHKISSIFNN